MKRNYFESDISSNELKGFAISGRMLAVEFSHYSLSCMEQHFGTVTLREYVGTELVRAVQTSIDGMAEFLRRGKTRYHHKTSWPRGDVDTWSFRLEKNGMVSILAKCHTGGRIAISLADMRDISAKAVATREAMWIEGAEFRAEKEKRDKARESA